MTYSLPNLENVHRPSVNDCWSCILGNQQANRLQTVINKALATSIRNRENDMLPALCGEWVSMECQQLLAIDDS